MSEASDREALLADRADAHDDPPNNGDQPFDAGAGPVLTAPDDSQHRVKVANDGTLSTEAV